MRPRMLEVGRFGASNTPFRSIDPELRKFAMLLVGTLKLPKLWNRFTPPPGLVPPVMSYCVFPAGGIADRVTCVFNPEGVIGAAAWTREVGLNARTSEKPSIRERIMVAYPP